MFYKGQWVSLPSYLRWTLLVLPFVDCMYSLVVAKSLLLLVSLGGIDLQANWMWVSAVSTLGYILYWRQSYRIRFAKLQRLLWSAWIGQNLRAELTVLASHQPCPVRLPEFLPDLCLLWLP